MNTAILVFILIVIAIAIFVFGLIVGSRSMCERLVNATAKAIAKSPLSATQRMELLDKIKEYAMKIK
jgi:Flp pilus assembly protein TadG